MPSLLTIKARLKAVENIKKITRAMQLVAAAKFKRAEQRAKASRPYSDELDGVLRVLAAGAGGAGSDGPSDRAFEFSFGEGAPAVAIEASRIFEQEGAPDPERPGLVLVTSDRGMCGAFNTKLMRAALEFARDRAGKRVNLIPLGRKGYQFFRRREIPILFYEERIGDALDLAEIRRVAHRLAASFAEGETDALYVLYAQFKNVTTSTVTIEKLFPIPRVESGQRQDAHILEPDPRSVYEQLLPLYATTKIYAALADSFASEYGARMTAMQSATKNAEEMIGGLVIERNRLRQAVITKELSEIVGASEALR